MLCARTNANARRREDAPQRRPLAGRLPGEVRHLHAHPRHQDQRQRAHDAETRPPAHQVAQKGACRHAERQRQGRADHGNRDGAPFLALRHHAGGVACRQRPQQPGRHARQETRRHDQFKARGDRGDGIGDDESANRRQQQPSPAHALRRGGQGDRRHERADGVDGHHLAGHRFGNAQAGADLREQARRQRFGQDRDETCQRQRQQRCNRQARPIRAALGNPGC